MWRISTRVCPSAMRLGEHRVRCLTTGEHHTYTPGPIARFLRSIVIRLPRSCQQIIGRRIHRGMLEVKRMEDELSWLKKHGSPLTVMGLPEEAELRDVKARYKQLVLIHHPDRGGEPAVFQRLQEAYEVLLNPKSVYYLDGMSPDLARELGATTARRVTLFGFISVCVGLLGVYILGEFIAAYLWEGALYFFDPKFYTFMKQQEKIEEDARQRGEEVNTDPKRYAPKSLQRLMFPGKFVHDDIGSTS